MLKAENTKGNKYRYVYFSKDLQKELKRWLQYKARCLESNYLFPGIKGNKLSIGIGGFETKLKQYGERIGINIHPHQLRNNFAKRFLMAGGNLFTLSKILGHSIIMMLIFSNIFSKRIITLRREMHKIAGGDFSIIEEFSGNDELGEFYSDMKLMLEGIKKLSTEILNGEISKEKLIIEQQQQQMKFEMLSSQIKPHFLFNTPESIRMKVFNNDEREIAKIIKLLGKSMRHVLDVKDELVTLESELKYIKIYIDIQMFRFGDKINYKLNIAENVHLESYFILPLLIQPIVENAIVHGIEPKDGDGLVEISIEEKKDILLIVVSDNGVGMGEEQKRKLLDSIDSSN